MVKRERHVVNGKAPQQLHFISCGFHQRSWFSQNLFEISTKALHDAVIHACAGVEVIPQGAPEE